MKLTDAIERVKQSLPCAGEPDSTTDRNAARIVGMALLDPTPVTGEALVAMGWHLHDWNHWSSPESVGRRPPTWLDFKDRGSGPRWSVRGETIGQLTTLGQVRCACLAFGIPMREEG